MPWPCSVGISRKEIYSRKKNFSCMVGCFSKWRKQRECQNWNNSSTAYLYKTEVSSDNAATRYTVCCNSTILLLKISVGFMFSLDLGSFRCDVTDARVPDIFWFRMQISTLNDKCVALSLWTNWLKWKRLQSVTYLPYTNFLLSMRKFWVLPYIPGYCPRAIILIVKKPWQ